jgi:hypothetical protein
MPQFMMGPGVSNPRKNQSEPITETIAFALNYRANLSYVGSFANWNVPNVLTAQKRSTNRWGVWST